MHPLGWGRDRRRPWLSRVAQVGKVTNSTWWSIGGQVSGYALSMLATAVLSRIISPGDYGILDMANTVIAFFVIFADGGIAWSVLQKKGISRGEVANLFWINSGIGALLAAFCFLSSGTVARFYGNDDLEIVLQVLSLNFLLSGFSLVGFMWLRRNLEQKSIAMIEIGSIIVSSGVGIYFATIGCGYWSLVAVVIVKTTVRFACAIFMTLSIVDWYDRSVPLKQLVSFGVNIQIYLTISYIYKNFAAILIGKHFGVESIAAYAKAVFLMNLPSTLIVGAVSGVCIPVLARKTEGSKEYSDMYREFISKVMLLAMPMSLFFVAFPRESVHFLYGASWEQAGVILAYLSLACLVIPLYSTMSWPLMASGRGRIMIAWGTTSALAHVTAAAMTVRHGPNAVAFAQGAVTALLLVGWGGYVLRRFEIDVRGLIADIFRIMSVLLVSMVLVKSALAFIVIDNVYVLVPVASSAFMLVAGAIFTVVDKRSWKERLSINV